MKNRARRLMFRSSPRDIVDLRGGCLLVKARHDNANVILHVVENNLPFRAWVEIAISVPYSSCR